MACIVRWLSAVLIVVGLIAGGCGAGALVSPPSTVSGLYVANRSGQSVTVYEPSATGDVAPIRTISGTSTGLNVPYGVALDAAGILYVSNGASNSITVYAPGATGDVAPIRTISGANTGLNGPRGM
ncbi:MAG TPA: hypothetical protein VFJ45_09125, partial [bacterium]|nr:hypothetical protein [bacterium]